MKQPQPVPWPQIFAVQFAAGRWFAIAPSRRVHDRGQERVELRSGIGQPVPPRPARRRYQRLAVVAGVNLGGGG